ncbi:VirK/YbjX family protein [Rouxiella sp. Mn2063]|uniref:VirK/YbjX family protein n=1 Tax=Rouxiella sp. Mn2063 TaxID=3395262 RepID=UPI003BC32660
MSALVSGQLTPNKNWRKLSYRLKFLGRSLVYPRSTLVLLNNLAQFPQSNEILSAQPTLPVKLHRPYMSANFSRSMALQSICAHYNYINQRLPLQLQRGHLSKQVLPIANLEGKGEQIYRITFNAISHLDKEGEATMMFVNAADQALAKVTFSFIDYQGQPTLFIGALQGSDGNIEHQAIQDATKACHGLFPKRILMEALLLMAEKMEMKQVFAVGNATHIYTSWRYKKRKNMMFADYDSFWETLGGEQTEQGYFRLPLRITHKPLESIASKKRAEYRRRYQLLDNMETEIRNKFTSGATL